MAARLNDVLLNFGGDSPDKTYRIYGFSPKQLPALNALVGAALTARAAGAA